MAVACPFDFLVSIRRTTCNQDHFLPTRSCVWIKVGNTVDSEGWGVGLARDGSVIAVDSSAMVLVIRYKAPKKG